ncbi:family 20 glycosylhydrolase [Evtepia sp.]|uniref:family 20 glycosylhydrolase n=1 Tax=Evtepia sp. TaxID=2773933 RepID=UPI002A8032C8|nr:family 20 glycosylhydrolase [Evtepia sp.]MDY4430453.1 family 20 glycosylhydrolase [Evtepia sp.]
MSRLKKGLALVLTLCMMLSLMPVITPSAKATDEGDDFYKIVHLDCGRKYFTADWIKSLIDEMAADGYTHLELAFGNDGLRFLLDDMSVTVGNTTYASGDVRDGIMEGNEAYYDFGTNELTQTEMDTIISYADEKGIGIIPLLNTPGHMDAIITCMENLGIDGDYNGSVRTVDVTNSTAVAFTQALVNKYIQYFAGKGCTVFNIGADEYANDVYTTGGMGFAQLVSAGQYDEFVTYINGLAALVKNAGMTPMAFNDGIYYNSTTSYGTFNKDIMIAYWSSGWDGYNVASASYLANQGHKMINTNGDFYYVLGKNDQFDSGSSYASNWDNAKFMGTTFDSEQAGSMFCIWCDYPNAETEDQIYTKVVTNGVLAAMSEAMGHMPENVTVKDEDTDVSITAPGLTSIAVTAQSAVTSGNTVSKTYSITLNGGDYTGKATVKIPYDNAFDGCVSFSGMVGTDSFDVNRDGDYFVATVPTSPT